VCSLYIYGVEESRSRCHSDDASSAPTHDHDHNGALRVRHERGFFRFTDAGDRPFERSVRIGSSEPGNVAAIHISAAKRRPHFRKLGQGRRSPCGVSACRDVEIRRSLRRGPQRSNAWRPDAYRSKRTGIRGPAIGGWQDRREGQGWPHERRADLERAQAWAQRWSRWRSLARETAIFFRRRNGEPLCCCRVLGASEGCSSTERTKDSNSFTLRRRRRRATNERRTV
jgi:hypothetical protein